MHRHDLTVLGHVARTHGVNGAVLIKGTSEYELSTEEPVFVDIQGPVPFFIESVKPGSGGWIVQFEWIDSMEKADRLVGKEVLIEADEQASDSEFPLVGYKILDLTTGRQGEILDVRPLDHHPLLITDFNGLEVMIPFVEEMIADVNESEQIVRMNLPEGLLDL